MNSLFVSYIKNQRGYYVKGEKSVIKQGTFTDY